MRSIQKRMPGSVVALVGVLVFGAAALVVMAPSSTRAITNIQVGSIKMDMVPNPGGANLEEFNLTYNGVGQRDISGWTISNNNGLSFTIPAGVVLQNAQTYKICAAASTLANCSVAGWTGDVWPDQNGTAIVSDASGNEIINKQYADPGESVHVYDLYYFSEPVYDANDKVDLCHSKDGVSYKSAQDNSSHLVTGQGGHGPHTFDVVPPFYYQYKTGGIQYFSGRNWSAASETMFGNGCQ